MKYREKKSLRWYKSKEKTNKNRTCNGSWESTSPSKARTDSLEANEDKKKRGWGGGGSGGGETRNLKKKKNGRQGKTYKNIIYRM